MIWFPLYLHCTTLSLARWVPTRLPFSSLVATGPFLFWAFATAFLSSLILFSQLSARCSHSHPSGGSSTHFPEWLSLLILMNKWLLTSYVKTSLVRQGSDGVASIPLDWVVGTCAPFLMLIDLLWLYLGPHMGWCWPVKFCTQFQFQCGDGFPTPPSYFLILSGYPTIHLNSDAIWQ